MQSTIGRAQAIAARAPRVRKLSARERRRHLQNWLLLAPQLALFLFVTVAPAIIGAPMLFTDRTRFRDPEVNFIGLANFTRVFWDKHIARDFWPALIRTARFTAVNTLGAYLFGFTLALLMYEVGFKGGVFTMIYMPYMLSGLALGFIALMLFGQSTGMINLVLEELGILKEPINIKTALGITVALPFLEGWRYAGWNMAIFLSGLLSIPGGTIESAVVDGATYLQRLWYIYLPQMIPTLIIVGTFGLMGSFQIFDVLIPLGAMQGNEQAEFMSIFIFKYGFTANKLALGLTLSIETLLPLMGIVVFLNWLQKRLSYEI